MNKLVSATSLSENFNKPIAGEVSPPCEIDPDQIQRVKDQSFAIPNAASTAHLLSKRSFVDINKSSDIENIEPQTKIAKINDVALAKPKPQYVSKFPDIRIADGLLLITNHSPSLDLRLYLPSNYFYENPSPTQACFMETMRKIYSFAFYSIRRVTPSDYKVNSTLELLGILPNGSKWGPMNLPFWREESTKEWQVWGTGRSGFVVKTCFEETRLELVERINDLAFGSGANKYLGTPGFEGDRLSWITLFAKTGLLFERCLLPPKEAEKQVWADVAAEMKKR